MAGRPRACSAGGGGAGAGGGGGGHWGGLALRGCRLGGGRRRPAAVGREQALLRGGKPDLDRCRCSGVLVEMPRPIGKAEDIGGGNVIEPDQGDDRFRFRRRGAAFVTGNGLAADVGAGLDIELGEVLVLAGLLEPFGDGAGHDVASFGVRYPEYTTRRRKKKEKILKKREKFLTIVCEYDTLSPEILGKRELRERTERMVRQRSRQRPAAMSARGAVAQVNARRGQRRREGGRGNEAGIGEAKARGEKGRRGKVRPGAKDAQRRRGVKAV